MNYSDWCRLLEMELGEPHLDYSYLEDLICWAIGIAAANTHSESTQVDLEIHSDGWYVDIYDPHLVEFVDRANSPISALEQLIDKLIGVE